MKYMVVFTDEMLSALRFTNGRWEAEVYNTKEAAEECAERIRATSPKIMINGECIGEMPFNVSVVQIER